MNTIMVSAMKRMTMLLVILLLWGILTGCETETNIYEGGNYGKAEFSFQTESDAENGAYVLNAASRKMHLVSCPYVAKIAEENRLYANDLARALAEGYLPCSHCLVDKTDIKEEEREK